MSGDFSAHMSGGDQILENFLVIFVLISGIFLFIFIPTPFVRGAGNPFLEKNNSGRIKKDRVKIWWPT
jgi:hypothetical protein